MHSIRIRRGPWLLGIGMLCATLSATAADSCSAKIQVIETSLDPAVGVEVKVSEAPGNHSTPKIAAKQTDSQGLAVFENLNPKKTPRLLFTISTDTRSATVLADVARDCHGSYRVVLPDKTRPNSER